MTPKKKHERHFGGNGIVLCPGCDDCYMTAHLLKLTQLYTKKKEKKGGGCNFLYINWKKRKESSASNEGENKLNC